MRHLLIITLLGFLLTSCGTTFKYINVENSQLVRNENHEFIHESDSVKVTFNFTGHAIPLGLKIENKVQTPLYVDWSRSALIVDGKRHPFYKNEGVINLRGRSIASTIDNEITHTDLKGSVVFNEALSFIPPYSFEQRTPMYLFRAIDFTLYNSTSGTIKYWNGTKKTHVSKFDKTFPQPEFRVYLTLSFDSQFNTSFALDETFHVAEIMETRLSPEERTGTEKHQGYISMADPETTATLLGLGFITLGTIMIISVLTI